MDRPAPPPPRPRRPGQVLDLVAAVVFGALAAIVAGVIVELVPSAVWLIVWVLAGVWWYRRRPRRPNPPASPPDHLSHP